jgi:purine-cytosine permease-like protein
MLRLIARKEIKLMQFLLSHWHCILPVLAIVAAIFFMNRGESKKKDQNNKAGSGSNEQKDKYTNL